MYLPQLPRDTAGGEAAVLTEDASVLNSRDVQDQVRKETYGKKILRQCLDLCLSGQGLSQTNRIHSGLSPDCAALPKAKSVLPVT